MSAPSFSKEHLDFCLAFNNQEANWSFYRTKRPKDVAEADDYLLHHVFLGVVVDDGCGDVMERLEPLFDGFLVVVHPAARLRTPKETFRHRVVWYFEIQDTFWSGNLPKYLLKHEYTHMKDPVWYI